MSFTPGILIKFAGFILLSTIVVSSAAAQGLLWARKTGAAGADQGNGIGLDGAGNTYVTGAFEGTVTFGAGEANQTILSAAGDQDIFIAKYNNLGALQWAKRAGGTVKDFAAAIAVDSAGNSYIAGFFEGTATFGAGEAAQTDLTSAGEQDIFIAKYTAAGSLVWAKRAGGTVSDVALAIAIDGSGNSYVTGRFLGTARFGPAEGGQTDLTSLGSADIFVAKFDTNGLLQRVRQDGGSGFDQGNSIALDGSGDTHVTGYFSTSMTVGGTTLNSAGAEDIFVARYDTAGAPVWAIAAGGTGLDQGNAIALDGSGNSYVTGQFIAMANFSGTMLTSAGSSDIFVAKYNSSGVLQWVKGLGSLSSDQGFGIDAESSGTFYVSGTFRNTVVFGQGEANQTTLIALGTSDAFHAKYNTNGTLVWARRSGAAGGITNATGITFDNSGNVYTTGSVVGTGIFGGGQASREVFTSAGGADFFVAKYGPNTAKIVQRDFDNDNKADVGIYREGAWAIVPTGGGGNIVVGHGSASHTAIPADYDGDTVADVAVYLNGIWSIRRSSLGGSVQVINLGNAGFTPVYADYDFDGKVDAAVYKDGTWIIRPSTGGPDLVDAHGGPAFQPIPGDYNGDGPADLCVYHPAGVWSTLVDSDGGLVPHVFGWGGPGWQPVPADYDGDGIMDVAVYHPDGAWSIVRSSDGVNVVFGWGGPAFIAVPGDYDGDGKADIAVYHPAGVFSIVRSSDSVNTIIAHGGNVADVPLR